MEMASWAVFLWGVVLVVSVAIPSQKDQMGPTKSSTTSPSKGGAEASQSRSHDPSDVFAQKKDRSRRYHAPVTQKDAEHDDHDVGTPKLSRRDNDKVKKSDDDDDDNQGIKTPRSKQVLQFTRLLKILFGQSFKLMVESHDKDNEKSVKLHGGRVESLLSILAIFSEHLQIEQAEEDPAAEPSAEDVPVTTSVATQAPESDAQQHVTSCLHVDGYDEHLWISVVNACPRDWSNETVRYLCGLAVVNDYPMTDTPVQDVQGTVYANIFCALCNHVHASKIRKWRIGWTCDSENPASSLLQPSPIDDLVVILEALRSGDSCKMIRTPAIPDSIYACSPSDLRTHQQMPQTNGAEHVPAGSGYPVSLNILMNFDFSGRTHIMFEDYYAEESFETKICPQDNYVWDGSMGRCREVVCARGFHFDDTYTTCVEDEDTFTISEDEVITDLSQLAQSSDIERVTLEVEVPSGFATLVTVTSNEFWKMQISKQLNISSNRIQQFNVSVEQATGEASVLVIQKLSSDDLVHVSETQDPNDGDDAAVYLGDYDVDLEQGDEGFYDDEQSEDVLSDDLAVLVGDDSSFSGSSTAQGPAQEPGIVPGPDMPDDFADDDSTTQSPQKFKIIMSFILLPPESFQSGEQRSGRLVQQLSTLVNRGELKFIINGTSLTVENMAQEDKVGVFSPACPHGLLLVLDGQQIELLYDTDSESSSNITMLRDLRTGKIYVRGMFDVSFLVTQPIGNSTQKAQSYVYNALACEMPHIANSQCGRIRITEDEYIIDPTMKILTFQNSTYNITSYEFLDDQYNRVEICVPASYSGAVVIHPSRVVLVKNCATGYEQWLKAEGYLTAVLGRLSIVALFTVLLTYVLFPSLRNLPGVNTMNLTFALFLAEVIFVTGEEVQIRWLCTAVATSLHYCFLSSHCWMNVMSYDVYRTFAGSTCILTRVRDKRKMFPRYALYAWGMPLLVIAVCLFIDLSDVFPSISIGYGGTWFDGFNTGHGSDGLVGNWSTEEFHSTTTTTATTTTTTTTTSEDKLRVEEEEEEEEGGGNSSSPAAWTSTLGDRSFSCWIQEPLAALFAFGAPVLLIFLMNCVFFTRTIASIRSTSRLARHSGAGRTNSSNSSRRQLSGQNDVVLYVKMSSVMGFTWVFGLASSVVSSVSGQPSTALCYVLHVLGVLFPILNSSQGLFIFFAFVFNRRVLGLYKGLGRRVRKLLLDLKSARNKPTTTIATIARD